MRRLMPKRKERGIALLVVLSSLALVGTVVAEFQFSSRVDLQLALNARDDLQAEYNALSALKLRAMLLRHSQQLQSGLQSVGQALGMDSNAMPNIGQMIDMIPVECGLLSTIAKKTEGGGDDENAPPLFEGDCTATSTSEHGKISVNMLANPTNNRSGQISQMLLALLSSPSLERHFEEDDRNGTHAESPAELVAALTDWIDANHTVTGNDVGDEDRFYSNLKDSYRAKNAPFDSLAEIQLVHGVDDELYAMLKDHLTIYADSTQIELGSAPVDRIVLGLFMGLRDGVGLQDLAMSQGLSTLVGTLVEMKQIGAQSFGVLNVSTLTSLVRESGLDTLIDVNRLSQVFTDQVGTTWYRIDAEGSLGRAVRRIHVVFQASEGQFYYYRIE